MYEKLFGNLFVAQPQAQLNNQFLSKKINSIISFIYSIIQMIISRCLGESKSAPDFVLVSLAGQLDVADQLGSPPLFGQLEKLIKYAI